MDPVIRQVSPTQAESLSAMIGRSFNALVAPDWEPAACRVFLEESSPARLRDALQTAAHAAGAFSDDGVLGFILMPRPSVLGMLFVDPGSLRLGIGRQLWEHARAHVETSFPDVKTVELNASPHAVPFYRSVGFTPISAEFVRAGCRATRMACWLPARALGAVL